MLTVGSLFSGIGGIDLGLERAGMTVKWQSEIDPYACKVLAKHWPDVPNLGDIKKIDWKETEYVDVIAGGYPCQPFSTAGKRAGEEDPRHLWPWVREAISNIRPRYAILENVRGHLTLGGLSVIGDLASIGYDAEWRIVSAASVGANHRRDRVIIVAYPDSTPRQQQCEWEIQESHIGGRSEDMADTKGNNGGNTEPHRLQTVFGQASKLKKQNSDIKSIGDWWKTEPGMGRVADGIPARVDRLKCLGNAVVPQVAELIGRLVVEHSTN